MQLNFFPSLLWLIFTVENMLGDESVHEIQTAVLQPLPYRLEDDQHLMSMGQRKRNKLCHDMRDKMRLGPSLELGYTPKAHVYKFNGKEEWLAIRCPTLPPLYVSHEEINGSIHHWHVWIVKPAMETYEFRFETAVHVTTRYDETTYPAHLPSTTHYFYKLDALKRWYLCREARRMIRYPVDDRDDTPERSDVYTFQYATTMWTEDYLAIECFGSPKIFLRTGDLEHDTNVIWIVLDDNGEDEEDESGNTDSVNSNHDGSRNSSRNSIGTNGSLEEYGFYD